MKYDQIAEAYKKLLNESIEHPMIEVDGVMKHRHNSLGQPIHHTDEGIRNFHRWFGDSRAVDEHGRPLVVYHGTAADIKSFDPNKIGSNWKQDNEGFFFTTDQNTAEWNSKKSSKRIKSSGPNVVPVYLSLKNSLNLKTEYNLDSNNYFDTFKKKILDNKRINDYDGIIIDDGISKQLVAFHPHQIKSAIGNTGEFSHPTKITESRFDSISSAYLKQINESIDITPIFNLHVDPTRYEVTSQKTSDYDPEQIDVKFRPKLSNTAVPYDYYTQRKRGQHWYEPEIATLSKEDMGEVFERQIPRLKPEYSTEIKTDLSKKLIYRGMSEDEFQNIMKTGKIKSHGDFNLEGQEGLTYFSTDPTSAQFYAHNFAPLNHKATGIHHAYVIGVENPGTGVHIEGTAEHEVGIPHEIDANKIKEIHRGRAYNISDGEYSFKKDWSKGWRSEPTYKPGSHMMPTVHLAWERIK